MLLKPCAMCGRLIPYGTAYCEPCARKAEEEAERRRAEAKKARDRKYNRAREPKYMRFYKSKDWRMLAARTLQDARYRCAKCGGMAVEVDHIVPIQTREGWDRRLDMGNTQALCHRCHDEKHGRFQPRKPKGR